MSKIISGNPQQELNQITTAFTQGSSLSSTELSILSYVVVLGLFFMIAISIIMKKGAALRGTEEEMHEAKKLIIILIGALVLILIFIGLSTVL